MFQTNLFTWSMVFEKFQLGVKNGWIKETQLLLWESLVSVCQGSTLDIVAEILFLYIELAIAKYIPILIKTLNNHGIREYNWLSFHLISDEMIYQINENNCFSNNSSWSDDCILTLHIKLPNAHCHWLKLSIELQKAVPFQ